jgi:hypothetical protein
MESAAGRVPPARVFRARQEMRCECLQSAFLFSATNFCSGSGCAGRARDLNAGKLTPNFSHLTADVHGRQWTTHLRL